MQSQYLGQVAYEDAIRAQKLGVIAGFESRPVVTLGLRAGPTDLIHGDAFWRERNYHVLPTDRGGQATIHNLGQLVIFPTLDVRPWGARLFVDHLMEATRIFLESQGLKAACRKGEPGLFTSRGKIMSVGLRIKNGVAHHGIAINVTNDLTPFAWIRVCGREGAPMDRLANYGATESLPELFLQWLEAFYCQVARQPQLTTAAFSPNLCTDARS